MSWGNTALTVPANPEKQEFEAGLRRVLDRMMLALDDAHVAPSTHAGMHVAMAKRCARMIEVGSFSAHFIDGPYAGLSVVSGLLSRMGIGSALARVQELAELGWSTRHLHVGLSPFADEMDHAPFQVRYLALSKDLRVESPLR